ncbi:MAG TPA: tRNA (adenosine(37)-N6)-threonylcarbamoyltransferase complex dimerization subunit type 1 TsaB [Verrucomicrobiae bacterium]|jgi:tRNA threonylcarbamoyladenosine biosynthesis protein TsaB|nr:tRNA (adenosine(37)-N6)-threonylcarbamoyltransferase complex dimerization subunit type 1 TsaB [Verrucomicrobiae bacterium]
MTAKTKAPVLALETSSPILGVAVRAGDGRIIEETLEGYSKHAENLLPMIEQALKKAGLAVEDIGTFLIGRGPGSFTGLRVGFATLKAFRILSSKPCLGALSLDIIAEAVPCGDLSHLGVCLDAHRDKIYTRLYKKTGAAWQPAAAPKLTHFNDWMKEWPGPLYLAGNALTAYKEVLEKAENDRAVPLPETYAVPRAASLIRIFEKNSSVLTQLETPHDFVPYYLRLSEAEERAGHHAPAC